MSENAIIEAQSRPINKPERIAWWRRLAVTDVGGMALFATAACGDNEPSQAQAESNTGKSDKQPQLVFDYLNGNSKIIQVYPGVTEKAADKKSNGTFTHGDRVDAVCKTEGRHVKSVPPEKPKRASDDWILIEGTPDEIQFATAVYIENPEQLLQRLDKCKPTQMQPMNG